MQATGAELIETGRSLNFWRDQPATDIGGLNARRVGFSQEPKVFGLGGAFNPPKARQGDNFKGLFHSHHLSRLSDRFSGGTQFPDQGRGQPSAAVHFEHRMRDPRRRRHQAKDGVRGTRWSKNILCGRGEDIDEMLI